MMKEGPLAIFHNMRQFITGAPHITSSVRFAKALHFLYKSWLYQIIVNENRFVNEHTPRFEYCSHLLHDRDRVLLSILRDCPLIDADHSHTFSNIHRHNIPTLVLWGESDGILVRFWAHFTALKNNFS
jgi:hypothetical protein